MLAVACLFVFLAVYVIAWQALKPRGVSVREEWTIEHAKKNPLQKAVYILAAGFVCALGAYGVTGQLHFAAIGLIGGYFAANALEKRRQNARSEALKAQYGQILAAIASAMQGSLSHYQALEDITPSLPNPGREVFTEILRRARTGSTISQAVKDVAEITGWDDLDSLAMAFRLYDTTGCNLVEVLNHLSEAIRERESDRKYTRAVTAEIRFTALILSLLPFGLMGATRVLAPDFSKPLFETTGGNIVVIFCVVMVLLGNRMIGRMVQKSVGS